MSSNRRLIKKGIFTIMVGVKTKEEKMKERKEGRKGERKERREGAREGGEKEKRQ